MKVTPFETYQSYLSMKNHFTNRKYDFFRYGGKSSATSYLLTKEKISIGLRKTSRKYSDDEIVNFLLPILLPQIIQKNLWIGEIINSGERTYSDWMRRQQSIYHTFLKMQSNKLLGNDSLDKILILKRW